MVNNDKYRLLKICLDTMAGLFLVIYPVCSWLIYIGALHSNAQTRLFANPSYMVTLLAVFGADTLPFALGILWFAYRIGSNKEKYPFVMQYKVFLIILLSLVVLPLLLLGFL